MGIEFLSGDCRAILPTLEVESFDMVLSSPPYWGLRDYNVDAQIGLEPTLDAYIDEIAGVARELWRVLKPRGTFWLNLGACYAGSWGARGRTGEATGLSTSQIKNAPNFGSRTGAVGGTRPSPYPRPQSVPAYGSDGTEQSGSRDRGWSCPDHGDERQDGYRNHHDYTVRSDQYFGRSSSLDALKGQDSERLDCALARAPLFRLPIGLSSLRNALDASYREATVSVSTSLPTSSGDDPEFAHRGARMPDTSARGWACRTSGKDVSETALNHPYEAFRSYLSIQSRQFKAKTLIDVPGFVAMALIAQGWILRSRIIWHKPNPMPESVGDRPTSSYECVFLLTKGEQYFYNAAAIAEPATSPKARWTDGGSEKQRGHARRHAGFNGRYAERIARDGSPATRNVRDVWTIATTPYRGAHFAVMPTALAERCILAGCPEGGSVLDPFGGAGTTGLAADRLCRSATLIDLNPDYQTMGLDRIRADAPLFSGVE